VPQQTSEAKTPGSNFFFTQGAQARQLPDAENHWGDDELPPYCHGSNSTEVTSVSSSSSVVLELSMAARCSVYLPLYSQISRSPHGVEATASVTLNHRGVNCSPLASRVLFSALCCSSSLKSFAGTRGVVSGRQEGSQAEAKQDARN
jgi:hypothetical protein